jgi:hypothetical protein
LSKNVNKSITLTQDQLDFLRDWAQEAGLPEDVTDSSVLRAALRQAFGDALPADPPSPGGYRGRRPRANETAELLVDFQKNDQQFYRAGTLCAVEYVTVRGVLVSFGDVNPDDELPNKYDAPYINQLYGSYAFLKFGMLKVSD